MPSKGGAYVRVGSSKAAEEYLRAQKRADERSEEEKQELMAKYDAIASYDFGSSGIRTGQNRGSWKQASTTSRALPTLGSPGYGAPRSGGVSAPSIGSGGGKRYGLSNRSGYTTTTQSAFQRGVEEKQRRDAQNQEQNLLARLQAEQDAANEANLQRYNQGLELYDRIIKNFEEGGAFERASLEELNRQKKRDVASMQSSLIGAGLANTTPYATAAQKYESEVGIPTRLGIRASASDRLARALQAKAGFMERRNDIGPSYADIARVR